MGLVQAQSQSQVELLRVQHKGVAPRVQGSASQDQPKSSTQWTHQLFPSTVKKEGHSFQMESVPHQQVTCISTISSANVAVDLGIMGPGSYFSQTYPSFLGSLRGSNTNSLAFLGWRQRALASILEFPLLLLPGAQLPRIGIRLNLGFRRSSVVSNNVLQQRPQNR